MTTSIKLAVFDVDGTLVDKEGVLLPRTATAIRKAQTRGVRVVLATGRPYHGVQHLVRELGLKDLLILANGALVTTAAGKILYQEVIPSRDCQFLLEYCFKQDLSIAAFTTQDMVYIWIPHLERDGERVLQDLISFGLVNRVLVKSPAQLPRTNVIKIMVSGKSAVQVRESMENWPNHLQHLNYGRSLPLWLEVNGSGVDKARALAFVARQLGIPPTAVLAVGDGETDISMLKWAGVGVFLQDGGVSVYNGKEFPLPHPVAEGAAWALETFVLV